MATRLPELISEVAATRPDDTALVFGAEVTTFGELDARTAALSASLASVAAPGDRVAFVGDNHPAWVTAYYGVPRGGHVLALLNHRLGPEQLRRSIERVAPAVLVAGQPQLEALASTGPIDALAPVVVTLDEVHHSDPYRSCRGTAGSDRPFRDKNEVAEAGIAARIEGRMEAGRDDVAWLLPTSGTSGEPKFVPLTHRNLLAAIATTAAVRPLSTDPGTRDSLVYSFPLCHVAGYNLMIFHAHGCPVVLLPRFDPADFVAQVNRHGVTGSSLAPTMIQTLVDHMERTGESTPTMRSLTYGASAISPTLLRRSMDVLGVDFHQGYGMTELAGNAVYLSPEDHRRGLTDQPQLLRSAGRPAATVDVRIVDDAGSQLPTGEVGEIAVRGEQLMAGYWNAAEINAEAFISDTDPATGAPTGEPAWFRTGDVGRFDDDGYLFIVDRKKDVIITGGEKVSSREVEDLLAAHPDIAEVAVIGVPDRQWGELVTAVVVTRPGSPLDEDALLAFGRDTIGGYQQPRRVVFVDELPRTPSGKVLKHELRSRFSI